MSNIFVIIVTYNGKQWYDRCFSSLRASEFPIRTIVIDNASSDDTVSYIRQNYPEIILIESDRNLGFGQANNLGMNYALNHEADYVFLLNQDAWIVESDIFVKLIEGARNEPKYAIISPVQLYGSGLRLTDGIEQHFVDGQTEVSDFISDLYFNRKLKEIYDVPYVCAASWFIPRKILIEIGGFDPIFFHYGEDDNYLQRIFYHGYRVGIYSRVSICHDVEFRKNESDSKHQNWQKDLLSELTNINTSVNLSQLLPNYLTKSIVQFFYFKFSRANYNLAVYKYLNKMKKEIENSRAQNKTIQSNWL